MPEREQITPEVTGQRGEQKSNAANGDHGSHQDIGESPGTDNRLFEQISGHHSPEAAPIVTAEALRLAILRSTATNPLTKAEETPKKRSDTSDFR